MNFISMFKKRHFIPNTMKSLARSGILNKEIFYEVNEMIVQLAGNVSYSITLDPSVWIFDDRKILFEEAFVKPEKEEKEIDPLEKAAKRWKEEVLDQKINPPVNKSITRFEKEKILKNTYVMPLNIFLAHAEVKNGAEKVSLKTSTYPVEISLDELYDSYALFAVKGKPLQEDGPIHLYFKDGSNKDNPIKDIKKITII